jgi:hypothetical protein
MKANKIQFSDASLLEIRGTSLHGGYVKSTACKISKALGCKIGSAFRGQYPTTFEWDKKYGSVVFTIYDYKQGAMCSSTVLDYHIGTKCPEDTAIIVEVLKGLGLDAYIEK